MDVVVVDLEAGGGTGRAKCEAMIDIIDIGIRHK